jgi:hypothetical protein
MPTPVSNIRPKSTTFTHEVALRRPNGQVWGLRLKDGAASLRDAMPQTHPPFNSINQFSFHLGRGWENTLQKNHMGFWDGKDAWSLTPQKLHATPLMQWSRGLYSQDLHWLQTGVETEYTDIVWQKIGAPGDPYLSTSFVSTGVTATRLQFYIRRLGNPGTLTVEVVENSSGDPTGTVRQSITVTKSDVTDFLVVLYEGSPSSYAFVNGTTYHVKFRSSDTDKNNCWEIGCNPDLTGRKSADNVTYSNSDYAPYFRLSTAATGDYFMFLYDSATYAVKGSSLYINGGRGKATSATSTTLADTALAMTADRYINAFLRIVRGTGVGQVRRILDNSTTGFTVSTWDTTPDNTSEYEVYGTPWFHAVGSTGISGFTSAASGSAGLTNCVSMPAVVNNICYFPQGDTVDIRRMQWNGSTKVHDFAAETGAGVQGRASFLESGYDPADGPIIWRANNATSTGSGGASTVSRAKATTWGVALVFLMPNFGGLRGIYIGDTSSKINGIRFHDNTLFVHKENGLFTVSNDRAVERKYGAEDMPSSYNGVAMASSVQFLYVSFWTTLMQITGGSVGDTKLWLSNLPALRAGHVVSIEAAFGWVFFALDAGAAGDSSVMAWNDESQSFHEVLRGYKTGKRIRAAFWQPCEDANPRLWTQVGSELVYQVFPQSPRPLADTSIPYQPEFVIESSTIDLFNTNPKYFGSLTVVSKNLSRSGHFVEVDYQTDNYVGTSTWMKADPIVTSPEDKTVISAGNKRMIRTRLRGLASNLKVPPTIEMLGMSFFERTVPPEYITLDCKIGPSQKVKNGGADDHKPTELLKALQEMNRRAEVLTVLSIDPELDGQSVTMYLAPRVTKEKYNFLTGQWTGTIGVYLFREVK